MKYIKYYVLAVFLLKLSVLSIPLLANPDNNREDSLIIKVNYLEGVPGDTLMLYVKDAGKIALDSEEHMATMDRDGLFHFRVPVESRNGYFDLKKKRTFTKIGRGKDLMYLMESQFWERNDNLMIVLSHKESGTGILSFCSFQGVGSDKYTVWDLIRKYRSSGFAEYDIGFNGDITTSKNIDSISASQQYQLEFLSSFRNKITPTAYNIIKADIIYKYRGSIFTRIKKFYKSAIDSNDTKQKEKIKLAFVRLINIPRKYEIPDSILSLSSAYIDFLMYGLKTYSELDSELCNPDTLFYQIKTLEPIKLRDALLVLYFQERVSSNVSEHYVEAMQLIRNPYYHQFVKRIYDNSKATLLNYTLIDVDGNEVKLSKYKGKIILLDFWFTGCGYCSIYYKNVLSKVQELYKNDNEIAFVSISIDKRFEKWKGGIQSGKYTSGKSLNFYTGGMGSEHSLTKENRISATPSVIISDKEGRIAYNNSTNLYDYQTLVETIENLRSSF